MLDLVNHVQTNLWKCIMLKKRVGKIDGAPSVSTISASLATRQTERSTVPVVGSGGLYCKTVR